MLHVTTCSSGRATLDETLPLMTIKLMIPAMSVVILATACGGGEMSLTEYVDQVNIAAGQASQRGSELLAEAERAAEITPQILQQGLERGLMEIRIPLQAAVDAMEPPEQVAELHHLMWDWHSRFIAVEQNVAARVGNTADTEAGWTDLSNSPEMAAYRNSVAEGKQLCIDFQSRLDATAERGVFEDTPWIPEELKEAVVAALGCEWFPEDPQSIYRYPEAAD